MAKKRRKTTNIALGAGSDKVDEGALALYLEDIKNHPLLTRAEEAELARRIREGDQLALEKLVRRGIYVGIATHDEHLVCGALAILDRYEVPRERYEFQMLLGVERDLRRILIERGHRLRVYVPYGRDWYAYSVRRLRENPEVARHVLRAMLPSGRSSGKAALRTGAGRA